VGRHPAGGPDAPPDLLRLLAERPRLVGVLHAPRLGGPARGGPPLAAAIEHVVRDAQAWAAGGADLLLLENYGDAPFTRGPVEPLVLTWLTRLALAVRAAVPLPLVVNVLRNDAAGALAVAGAVGGCGIRVNVLAGVVATDQGLIEGDAAAVAAARRQLEHPLAVLADVDVKHGRVLWGTSLGARAADLVRRAGADALVVTGEATGQAAVRADLDTVLAAVPEVPVLVGSGLAPDNAATLLPGTRGAIVATAAQRDGHSGAPVDVERVRELIAAAHAAWGVDGPGG
jgi:hypothetical protein